MEQEQVLELTPEQQKALDYVNCVVEEKVYRDDLLVTAEIEHGHSIEGVEAEQFFLVAKLLNVKAISMWQSSFFDLETSEYEEPAEDERDGAIVFFQNLASLPELVKLEFIDMHVEYANFNATLKQLVKLKYLALSDNGMDNEEMKTLLDGLVMPSMIELCVSYNRIQDTEVFNLIPVAFPNLQVLEISESQLSSMDLIIQVVASLPHLKRLIVSPEGKVFHVNGTCVVRETFNVDQLRAVLPPTVELSRYQ